VRDNPPRSPGPYYGGGVVQHRRVRPVPLYHHDSLACRASSPVTNPTRSLGRRDTQRDPRGTVLTARVAGHVHAERCALGPWPGAVFCQSGTDAGAVATRAPFRSLFYLVATARGKGRRAHQRVHSYHAPLSDWDAGWRRARSAQGLHPKRGAPRLSLVTGPARSPRRGTTVIERGASPRTAADGPGAVVSDLVR